MLWLLVPKAGRPGTLLPRARDRIRAMRVAGDKGAMSAEAMIIIGILVATAITALGIIAAKVIAKANSIDLG